MPEHQPPTILTSEHETGHRHVYLVLLNDGSSYTPQSKGKFRWAETEGEALEIARKFLKVTQLPSPARREAFFGEVAADRYEAGINEATVSIGTVRTLFRKKMDSP